MFKLRSKKLLNLILFIGMLLSIMSGWYTYQYYDQEKKLNAELKSHEVLILIKNRMAAYEQVLKSGVGLFKASPNVSRKQWAIFVDEHKLDENFKGIQGFGYSEVVLPENKTKHEERIKKEGFNDFKIHPAGQRELYTSIVYLEPFDERNIRAFGYDMFSEKVRNKAMSKAIKSAKATLSGKITLVQEFDTDIQAGFLMYLPLYKVNAKIETRQERMSAIKGFVYAPFRADDLMHGILGSELHSIDFTIYDGSIVTNENLLYNSDTTNKSKKLFKKVELSINGHTWTIVFTMKELLKDSSIFILMLIPFFILMLTYLLYLLMKSLIRTKEDAQSIAEELTKDLKLSQERLQFSLEGTGNGLWDWNIKTNEVFFSKRWKEMLGFKEDEITDSLDEWQKRVHEDDLEDVFSDVKRHLEGKCSYRNEHRVKCKDGSYKWILDRGMIVSYDTDGTPLRMVGSHADISERKNAQIKLDEYLITIDNNVISSATDLHGLITKASQAFCDISGYSKEELIGNTHSMLRHPDMSTDVYKELWETILSGKEWDGEIKNKKKNGEYYWVKSRIIPEYNNENKIIGYSSVRHDITSQKAKEDFMSNMSHELRTPLNAIIGFSSILKKKQTEPKNIELSETIYKSSKSLLHLINDILDLAKIEDSNFKVDSYEFNAYNEFSEFSEQFEGLTHKKTLNYKIKIDDALKGIFYGDWNRISQVISNLVSNSIKFTPKDGLIEVSGDYKDDCFTLSVCDNGIGMNKEVQDKIFKPFSQADGSTTRKYGGTGLGLSITQNLVELMGGRIELESQEGAGTTFKVSLPLEKLREDTQVVEIDTLSEDDKEDSLEGHILIVEDNKTNQMLVKMLITDFGLTCDVANDGLEAVAMYDPQKHQLVLMDENMPNLNGIEAMKAIKEKHQEKTSPIIALTANAMKGDRERFLSLGMDDYIEKPIDEDELYRVLKEFL